MTAYSTVIKLAPILTAERWADPIWTRPGRALYWPGSIKPIPRMPAPVVINHDLERRIGVVDRLFQMDWTDGPWICASATVTDPPSWLRRHDTKASFASWDVHAIVHADGWTRVVSTVLQEVSLLIGRRPKEPLACVLSLRELAPAAEAGEVVYGGQILRRSFPSPVTVR